MAQTIKKQSKANTMKPLVSVVMSAYNCEQYIAEAIDSILAQTFTDFEFIIINDGSTDNTLKIIKSYEDPRIIMISRANKGLVSSLNEGIEMARGKYIARQDGDDVSRATRLEKQVKYMNSNIGCMVLGALIDEFDELGSPVLRPVLSNTISSGSLEAALLAFNPLAHGSVVFRKDAFLEAGGYDSSWFMVEDYHLWYKLAMLGRLAVLPEKLYGYRVSDSGISMANIEKQQQLVKKLQQDILSNISLVFSAGKRYSYPLRFKKVIISKLLRAGKTGVCLKLLLTMRGSMQNVPRVIIVNNSTFVGGGEVYTKTLMEALKSSVDYVAVTSSKIVQSYLQATGGRVLLFRPLITSERLGRIIPFTYSINKLILQARLVLAGIEKYPIVHFQQPNPLYVDAFSGKRKSILTVHSNYNGLEENTVLSQTFSKMSILIVVARTVSNSLVKQGILLGKIRNIANGVMAVDLLALPISRKRDKIVWVGRIDGQDKNPGLFYDIAFLSQELGLKYKYEFIGNGNMKGLLERRTKQDNLLNIGFTGHISDTKDIYKNAVALCITSDKEAFPLVMLEAMAAGVPIISTDVGDVKNVLGGNSVVAANSGAFIEKIKDLQSDSKYYEMDAVRLRKIYEASYTAERMANATLKVYTDLL